MSLFSGGSTGSTAYVPPAAADPTAALPAAPPNPPIYGAQQSKAKAGGGATQQFNSTVIGTLPQNQPQRTLLGAAA